MFTRTAIARSRLVWSRWLVLALMTLCLPLQGALAVTMKVCAMPVDQSAAGHAMSSHAVDGAGHVCCPDGGSHRMDHAPAINSDGGGGNPNISDISGGGTSNHSHSHSHSHTHSDSDSDSDSDFSGSHAPACHTASDGASAQHDCSMCAQCSVGAAMMPFSLPLLPAVKPADVLPALNARAAAPAWPRSLDRPPKPILA